MTMKKIVVRLILVVFVLLHMLLVKKLQHKFVELGTGSLQFISLHTAVLTNGRNAKNKKTLFHDLLFSINKF